MKVISIRQPWASLIINGYKKYEFRTWKTNYRGPVYIHASQSIEKENLKRFESLHLEYPTGKILGTAEIINCISVNEEFEDTLIRENELIYGASRNRTGYAFHLDKIKEIDPILVKGKLGLWNYEEEKSEENRRK